MRKRLLLLLYSGGSAPDLIYPSISKLDTDIVTIYIRPENKALNDLYNNWVGKYGDAIEVKSFQEMVTEAIAYHENKPIHGVITFGEMVLDTAAQIAEKLNLPYNTRKSIELSQNKYLQRKVLHENGVPVPKFHLIEGENDLKIACEKVGFPAVLKPVYGAGGYHIASVESYQELVKVYTDFTQSYKNYFVENGKPDFLLEERMEGVKWHKEDYYADYLSVESVIHHGEIYHLCVTDRTEILEPFRETGYMLPSTLGNDSKESLYQIAAAAIHALGLKNGVTHIEIKLTESGPKIIEVNARPGGGIPFRLRLADPDYDLFYEMGRLSLGEKPKTIPDFKRSAGSFLLHGPNYNVKIAELSNIQTAREIPGLELLIMVKEAGTILDPKNSLMDMLGFAYVSGKTHSDLIAIRDQLIDTLNVKYEPV
ncbi:ATP-grasp domain-containing protein [Cytobacillus firmus]|uniref:ATP-grasp domain-containing protein n=1 Tax=Cytobacillus firmus TaxID=1399 RepID=UPI00207AEA17|nr:ATP-grasp domain-containing protein [Cytobacillus firmus]USK37074.1 ATP-grasp domain-containing protein [Cytobacillus firmus]